MGLRGGAGFQCRGAEGAQIKREDAKDAKNRKDKKGFGLRGLASSSGTLRNTTIRRLLKRKVRKARQDTSVHPATRLDCRNSLSKFFAPLRLKHQNPGRQH